MKRTLFVATLIALAPAAAYAFAALAIDTNRGTAYGWGAGYNSQAGANTRAHQQCGTNCRLVMQWDTGCGAYYADVAPTNISAIGTGLTANQAKSNAYRACTDRGGFNCQLRVWACDRGAQTSISGGNK